MHFLTRITLTTLAAFTVLGTTTGECPEWLRLDLEVVRNVYSRVIQEQTRREELAEKETALQGRMQGKAEVAIALADGRLTLPRAAARFRRWMKEVQSCWDAIELSYSSGTTDEKLCRYVIDWTRLHLVTNEPEKARATTRRLNAELDELLCNGGALIEP
jgi:hypothetical protein